MSKKTPKSTEGEAKKNLEDVQGYLNEACDLSYSILETAAALDILMTSEMMGELEAVHRVNGGRIAGSISRQAGEVANIILQVQSRLKQ